MMTLILSIAALLSLGAQQPEGSNLMLFYGEQLTGTPFAEHTLEGNASEELVVRVDRMDCTTFVETVLALALTTAQGSQSEEDFRSNLTLIRYQDGNIEGYASRNHYFTWWTSNAERHGFASEVHEPAEAFSANRPLKLNYMTAHRESNTMYGRDAAAYDLISKHEAETTGQVSYIPKSTLAKHASSVIEDGDILAMVSNKAGLDVSHIGIAKYDSEGRLHMLNCSQIHGKVVTEPMTLWQYMQRHPSQLGVRVVRPRIW